MKKLIGLIVIIVVIILVISFAGRNENEPVVIDDGADLLDFEEESLPIDDKVLDNGENNDDGDSVEVAGEESESNGEGDTDTTETNEGDEAPDGSGIQSVEDSMNDDL